MINGDEPPFAITHIDSLFLSETDKKPKKDKKPKQQVLEDKLTNASQNLVTCPVVLSENDKIFIRKCQNIDVKYINQYGDWIKIIWAIRSINQELRHFALELTKKSHYYKTDDYFEDRWDKYDYKGFTEGTINYYSND